MKLIIEHGDIVTLAVEFEDGRVATIPMREWRGHTESGIPVAALVFAITPQIPRDDPRQAEFRDLFEMGSDFLANAATEGNA